MVKDVVGFGSLNLDVFYRMDDPGLLLKDGWPVVPGGEVFLPDDQLEPLEAYLKQHANYLGRSGGGSAANTVVALSRMGFSTGFVGVVGDDSAGVFLRQAIRPVDPTGIRVIPGRSGTCLIVLDPQGDRTLVVFPQANARLAAFPPETAQASSARFVHITSLVDSGAREVQCRFVDSLPASVKLSFDPGEIYAREGLEAMRGFLRRAALCFLNAKEVRLLTGCDDLEQGAALIMDSGPGLVVVKQGARGARVFLPEDDIEIPVVCVDAVDTTGAGDVFEAGFLAGWLKGLPPELCGRLGAAAAARSVTGPGREKYPDALFLERWLAEEAGPAGQSCS